MQGCVEDHFSPSITCCAGAIDLVGGGHVQLSGIGASASEKEIDRYYWLFESNVEREGSRKDEMIRRKVRDLLQLRQEARDNSKVAQSSIIELVRGPMARPGQGMTKVWVGSSRV